MGVPYYTVTAIRAVVQRPYWHALYRNTYTQFKSRAVSPNGTKLVNVTKDVNDPEESVGYDRRSLRRLRLSV